MAICSHLSISLLVDTYIEEAVSERKGKRESMDNSLTVILKESRGFDRVYQLMYMPNPIWTQNEDILDEYTPGIKGVSGRIKDLLRIVKNTDPDILLVGEAAFIVREECYYFLEKDIMTLISEAEEKGFSCTVMKY